MNKKTQPVLSYISRGFCSEAFLVSSQPITNSPPKWMAELESEDIEMLKGKCFFIILSDNSSC